MRKQFPTFLATMISCALYGMPAYASLTEQCKVGVPQFERPYVEGEAREQQVKIESDKSDLNYPYDTNFIGDVVIEQGNRRLRAENAKLTQDPKSPSKSLDRKIVATGNVNYDDDQILLSGSRAWSDLDTKDTDIYDSDFKFVGRQGRGDASKISLRENRFVIMKDGTFTTCLPGNNSWSFAGSEIIQDNEEQLAKIKHARFRIGSVPIFYSPYLQIPTGDKRRSGFLLPSGKYSNSGGLQISLPYYWNIAPNYDMTLTPHLYTNRGLQLQNEFRYLNVLGRGLMEFDGLLDDREYRRDFNEDDNDRWLFHWRHGGVINQVWRLNVNYTKVSDNRYLNDLDTEYGDSTDGYITQKYSVGYADRYWDTSLSMKQFQIFSTGGNKNAYRAEPQFDFTNYLYDVGPFHLTTTGQIARFTSENVSNPKVTRLHIEPTLSLPIYQTWGTLNTELSLLATHFQQDIPNSFDGDLQLDDSVNRFLPKYKLFGKLVFDRPMYYLPTFTQTLEPTFQYLYIPYKDQSNIYTYDTTLLQTDYTGLFRDRLYSGLDRIASANQLAAGITNRIYDESLNERFNFSIGQIYYFEASRTGDEDTEYDRSSNTGSRAWAADSFWQVTPKQAFRTGVQYDDRLGNVSLADAIYEYKESHNQLLQLSYRYANQKYISAMINNRKGEVFQQDINQLGALVSTPISANWAAVLAYYHDPKINQMNDGLIGLQYANCCWGFNVSLERKIVDWNNDNNRKSNYDNKFSFSVELRGFGREQTLSTAKMLRTNILPYQRSF